MTDDLHAELTAGLLDRPYWDRTILTDPAWRKAWDALPRHLFVPEHWFTWDGARWVERSAVTEPKAWRQTVYSDTSVVTQITGGIPSCSNSQPSLVAAMLDALDVADGMRVFESGAGTGWTSSLLAARLGNENVVSVEYDPLLADQARGRARAAGRSQLIVAGDGEVGYAARAPFDRVSATHSVPRIPTAWIAQTRPGGLVVAPVRLAGRLDLLVALTVQGDGSASGPVLFPVEFMSSRAPAAGAAGLADDEGREKRGTLDVPAVVAAGHRWVLELAVPGLTVTGPLVEDGDDTVWLQGPDGSWAVAWVPHGASWADGCAVEQHGPQDVWTAAQDGYAAWAAAGGPDLDRYGLAVASDGTHSLWLDEPGNTVSVLSAA